MRAPSSDRTEKREKDSKASSITTSSASILSSAGFLPAPPPPAAAAPLSLSLSLLTLFCFSRSSTSIRDSIPLSATWKQYRSTTWEYASDTRKANARRCRPSLDLSYAPATLSRAPFLEATSPAAAALAASRSLKLSRSTAAGAPLSPSSSPSSSVSESSESISTIWTLVIASPTMRFSPEVNLRYARSAATQPLKAFLTAFIWSAALS